MIKLKVKEKLKMSENSNRLPLRYFPENFNFMFSILKYEFERITDPRFKDSIYNTITKIEECHSWLLEDKTYLQIELDASDVSVINFCLEDVFMETFEAKQKMYGKTDYFRIMYEEDKRRQAYKKNEGNESQ